MKNKPILLSALVVALAAHAQTRVVGGANTSSGATGLYYADSSSFFFDDYYSGANLFSSTIGSPAGQGCGISPPTVDVLNHPGAIRFFPGTAGAGTGMACSAAAFSQVASLNTAPGWQLEFMVWLPVLPGTSAASYQVGMTGTLNVSPWTNGIGWYLAYTNTNPNNWNCRYGTTQTDTGVVASNTSWTRLKIIQDGTLAHWYINGTEITACQAPIASLPAVSQVMPTYSVIAGNTTNNTFYVDYVNWYRAVTR